jgi:hypothetical protein
MKLDKPWIITKTRIEKITPYVVPEVATMIIAIDNHMAIT